MEFKASRLLGVLPLVLSLAFGGFVAFPQVRANPVLLYTFLITAGILVAWWIVLTGWMARQHRVPALAVALLKQHYVQAFAHTSILVYWGWWFRPVYAHGYLILAQLVFAYIFDMLLQLSRRGRYTLGFGPFPIVLSTNLFLWFVDDWFYLQFVLIAVGFAVKELIHWTRNRKSVHIFNPSSFPLAIASWLLLFTHSFGITWGEQIAGTQFRPPGIYIFIFLVSLPGQLFFGVVTMTLAAVLTMYAWGATYMAITGAPSFYQGYIPIAVFLAMNLLFTDPSTSPRSELGRILYGIAYAVTVIILEATLVISFPSKLLLVPALNLAVPLFERVAHSRALRWLDPGRVAPEITGRRRNLAYMTVWASVFSVMLSLRGIGDSFPAQELPFWRQACHDHGARACRRLTIVEGLACRRRSGWSCNEFGIAKHDQGKDLEAVGSFATSCQLGFSAGCDNSASFDSIPRGYQLKRGSPVPEDYRVLLSLFKWIRRESLDSLSEPQLLAEACRKGWTEACGESERADRAPLGQGRAEVESQ